MAKHIAPGGHPDLRLWSVRSTLSLLCRLIGALTIWASFSLYPLSSLAALSARDLETTLLERKSADDPLAAIQESATWWQRGLKEGDKALQLKALRLKVMAIVELDDTTELSVLAMQGLALAQEQQDRQAECEFLTAKATAVAEEGKYVDSLLLFDQSLAVAENAKLERTAIGVQVSKAYIYSQLGRNTDALDLLFKAHQRYQEIGDEQSARATLSEIGRTYSHSRASTEDLLKALSFHQRGIEPGARRDSRHDLSTIYFNIAAVYQRLKDWPNATEYLQRSMALSRELKDPIGEAFGNYRLGLFAASAGKWLEALEFGDKALPVLTNAGKTSMVFNVQRARATNLAHLQRRRESLAALREAEVVRKRIQSTLTEANYLATAAEVYSLLGEFEKAFRLQVELREAEQAMFSEAREKDAAEAQTRFEVKQKEAENELLRAKERASEARRVALVLAVVLLLFLIGGLGLFLFRQGRQNRRFANLAMRDDLTGLPNRRSILEYARVQLRASRAEDLRMCLAILDIDHFKVINDACGHAVGDAVLSAFAEICAQQLRSNDRLGRYGGEEFLLIMPGSDLHQVPLVFARLREAVQLIEVPGLAPAQSLTFSMGAVEVSGPTDELDHLIKRADDALYRAKQGGRDRYELDKQAD